ncbi:MAG TPA: hypothetical protein VK369_12500, partial [Segetibacter sp.]|nr:hypothetical protein [Segetibacter sp.]
KKTVAGITPIQVATNLQKLSGDALLLVAGMRNTRDKELRETIGDIKAMSFLGQYYSKKILGATYKNIYDQATDPSQKIKYKNAAIRNLQVASNSWRKYATQVTNSYIPQHLTRMHFTIDFKAMQAYVDKEVTMFTAKLPEAGLDMKPPLQQLEVVFSKHSNYYFWHLDKLGLPANWTSYKYFILEVFATRQQPFDIIVGTARDTIIRKDIKPAEKAWTRIAVPIETFRPQFEKGENTEAVYSSVSLNEVLGIGVSIEKPLGYPVLEIRSIKLSNQDVEKSTVSSTHR